MRSLVDSADAPLVHLAPLIWGDDTAIDATYELAAPIGNGCVGPELGPAKAGPFRYEGKAPQSEGDDGTLGYGQRCEGSNLGGAGTAFPRPEPTQGHVLSNRNHRDAPAHLYRLQRGVRLLKF
jgi:hypothetical protein